MEDKESPILSAWHPEVSGFIGALILFSGCNRWSPVSGGALRLNGKLPLPTKKWKAGRQRSRRTTRSAASGGRCFNEPQLDALEEKVNVSNQNIASAAASFLAARALVKEARSQLFPTVTTNPSITVQRPPSSSGSGSSSKSSTGTFTDYTLPFDATWQPDLFGRIRNTVKAAAYGAQASAADLENTRLRSMLKWPRITFNFAGRMR